MFFFFLLLLTLCSKKTSNPESLRFTSVFSSESLSVLVLMFRLTHLELIFVYGVREGFNFVL